MLDMVLGNEMDKVVQVSVEEHLRNSDHCIIKFTMIAEKDDGHSTVRKTNCGTANCNGIRTELGWIAWIQRLVGRL